MKPAPKTPRDEPVVRFRTTPRLKRLIFAQAKREGMDASNFARSVLLRYMASTASLLSVNGVTNNRKKDDNSSCLSP